MRWCTCGRGLGEVVEFAAPLGFSGLFGQEVQPASCRVFLHLAVPQLVVVFEEPVSELAKVVYFPAAESASIGKAKMAR